MTLLELELHHYHQEHHRVGGRGACRSLRRGIKAGASPPPSVAMAPF